jgi:hypothetical protein
MAAMTGFDWIYVIGGIDNLRMDGYVIRCIPGIRTPEGVEPSTFQLEDRPHDR